MDQEARPQAIEEAARELRKAALDTLEVGHHGDCWPEAQKMRAPIYALEKVLRAKSRDDPAPQDLEGVADKIEGLIHDELEDLGIESCTPSQAAHNVARILSPWHLRQLRGCARRAAECGWEDGYAFARKAFGAENVAYPGGLDQAKVVNDRAKSDVNEIVNHACPSDGVEEAREAYASAAIAYFEAEFGNSDTGARIEHRNAVYDAREVLLAAEAAEGNQ